MTSNRKRPLSQEQIQEALARGNADGMDIEHLPDILSQGLVSGVEEKILNSLALLCSVELPLDSLLRVLSPISSSNTTLLSSLITLIESDNSILAAEAAAVLRSWVMNVKNVHILYAHIIFPWLLSLLERASKTICNMGEAFQGQRNELLLWEHWLQSILLCIWAIVEEIPQSIPQLNENGTYLLELTCSLFEKKMFFNQDTFLLLLRLLLCAIEDNGQLHTLNPAQFIRLESMLTNLKVTEGENAAKNAHLKFLANLLLHNIDGGKIAVTQLLPHLTLNEQVIGEDELEFFADVLESLANAIGDDEDLLNTIQMEIVMQMRSLIDALLTQVEGDLSKTVTVKCIERSLGCIFNVFCAAADDCDIDFVQSSWSWCINSFISQIFSFESPSLNFVFGEISRFLMLQLLHTNKPVLSSQAVEILRSHCNQDGHAEDVTVFWLPILAILLPEDQTAITLGWLNEKCISNISRDLSWRETLGIAEVLEELLKHNALSDQLRLLIRDKKTLILRRLKRELTDLEDKHDEIHYVETILRQCA